MHLPIVSLHLPIYAGCSLIISKIGLLQIDRRQISFFPVISLAHSDGGSVFTMLYHHVIIVNGNPVFALPNDQTVRVTQLASLEMKTHKACKPDLESIFG